MARSLWFFLKLGLFVAPVTWLWLRASFVTVAFGDWELSIHPLGILLGLGTIWLLWHGVKWAAFLPLRIFGGVRRSVRSHGQEARREHFWYALEAFFTGDLEEAIEYAENAKGAFEDKKLVDLLKASIARKAGDFKASRQGYLALASSSETAFISHMHLGLPEEGNGSTSDRIEHLKKAAMLRSGSNVLEHLAKALIKEKDFEEANRVLDRLFFKNPVRANTLKAQLLYERAGACEELYLKRKFLKKALSIDPKNIQVVCELAVVFEEDGKHEEAIAVLEDLWRKKTDRAVADLYFRLCGAYDPLERVKRTQRLASFQTEALETFLLLSRAFMAASLWGESRRCLEKALSTFPDEPMLYAALAALELKENKNPEAALLPLSQLRTLLREEGKYRKSL